MGARSGADTARQKGREQAPRRRARDRQRANVRVEHGGQWRAIPKDLPARSTLHGYLDLWSWDRTLDRIHYALYVECREHAEREASPTAAIIDSQSVKSAEKGGALIDPHGYDAGKSAPRWRVSPVEEGSTQRVVD